MNGDVSSSEGPIEREPVRALETRKVLLYTHALAGGGAERALALLASGLAQRGPDVIFVADYRAAENEAFLDPAVRRGVTRF